MEKIDIDDAERFKYIGPFGRDELYFDVKNGGIVDEWGTLLPTHIQQRYVLITLLAVQYEFVNKETDVDTNKLLNIINEKMVDETFIPLDSFDPEYLRSIFE